MGCDVPARCRAVRSARHRDRGSHGDRRLRAHYIVALQDHASVLFRADAVALDAVAVRFANMEARILEAEAWAEFDAGLHLDAVLEPGRRREVVCTIEGRRSTV